MLWMVNQKKELLLQEPRADALVTRSLRAEDALDTGLLSA